MAAQIKMGYQNTQSCEFKCTRNFIPDLVQRRVFLFIIFSESCTGQKGDLENLFTRGFRWASPIQDPECYSMPSAWVLRETRSGLLLFEVVEFVIGFRCSDSTAIIDSTSCLRSCDFNTAQPNKRGSHSTHGGDGAVWYLTGIPVHKLTRGLVFLHPDPFPKGIFILL